MAGCQSANCRSLGTRCLACKHGASMLINTAYGMSGRGRNKLDQVVWPRLGV